MFVNIRKYVLYHSPSGGVGGLISHAMPKRVERMDIFHNQTSSATAKVFLFSFVESSQSACGKYFKSKNCSAIITLLFYLWIPVDYSNIDVLKTGISINKTHRFLSFLALFFFLFNLSFPPRFTYCLIFLLITINWPEQDSKSVQELNKDKVPDLWTKGTQALSPCQSKLCCC